MMKYKILFILLIIMAGLGLRIYHLGTNDLWWDEALTAYLIQYPKFIGSDIQAPLYTWITLGWGRLTGSSEFALRFPAMLFGIFSIPGIYFLGQYLFSKNTGLISAFLLAISPFHIWYSQDARAYSLAVFLVILVVYFFLKAIKEDKKLYWVGFTSVSILGLYSNYLTSLLIIPEIILLIKWRRKGQFKNYFLSWCIIAITFLPWLPFFWGRLLQVKEVFWIPKPDVSSLLITFANFNLGYTAEILLYIISGIVFSVLLILGIFSNCSAEKRSILAVSSFLFLPIFVAFIISQWRSVYLSRLMLLFLPPYLILVGRGISYVKGRFVKFLLIFVMLLLSSFSLRNYYTDYIAVPYEYHQGSYIKRPVRPTVEYIKENFKDGDIIACTNTGLDFPLWYYWGRDYKFFYFIIPEAQDEYWRNIMWQIKKRKEPHPFNIIDLSKDLNLNYRRAWLVSSNWARDGGLDSNSLAVREWMSQRFDKLLDRELYGIFVSLYELEN